MYNVLKVKLSVQSPTHARLRCLRSQPGVSISDISEICRTVMGPLINPRPRRLFLSPKSILRRRGPSRMLTMGIRRLTQNEFPTLIDFPAVIDTTAASMMTDGTGLFRCSWQWMDKRFYPVFIQPLKYRVPPILWLWRSAKFTQVFQFAA